jgi:hypothetical protein
MASKKRVRHISSDSVKFEGFQPIFQILPDPDEISPESLFTHAKITVEDMLEKKKLLLKAF